MVDTVRRGFPTLVALVLVVGGLGMWAWWLGQSGAAQVPASGPSAMVARPVPEKGWGAMRVMAANVRLDDPKDGDNAWLKRRELLVKTLLKYQPEVLACQEILPVQGAYLNKELATWYAYFPRAGVGQGQEGGGTRSAAAELLGMLGGAIA